MNSVSNGSSEIWRAVRGYEGCYEVSDQGRVRSLDRLVASRFGMQRKAGIVLKTNPGEEGYHFVQLSKEGKYTMRYIHHLVAEAFIGDRPDGAHVAHGDGDSENNWLWNLRYATPIENEADKISHGTKLLGESHHQAKLNESAVLLIRSDCRSASKIAAEYGINKSAVVKIKARITWSHVQ